MSSDSDEYIHNAHSPHCQSSSTPETPRKRRRSSTVSSRQRRHKQPRRHDVESHYSDEYRGLFNDHVKNAASRFEIHETARDNTSQIGLSIWTPKEKAVFFAALERLGRDDLPGIAGAVGTKSALETRDFLFTLQDATIERGDTKLTLRDIPAAIDLAPACNQQLERAADALAWYQERHEASLEQERYGEYWLITPHMADDIDDAINGVVRPRSASTPYDETKRAGGGIVGSCIPCKTRKVKCDRGRPCGRCVRTQRECEYPGGTADAVKADELPHVDARPRSASRPAHSEHDQAGGGFVGACIACKKVKRKCERGTPCERCTSLGIDCQYARLTGSGVAGACDWCRKSKIKCDRGVPCANCTRTESECVYVDHAYHRLSRPPSGPSPAPSTLKEDSNDDVQNLPTRNEMDPKVLQKVPEATFLNAKMMLRLSRDLFMNRSPDFPSPWPHWSEYTSELASDPSMYRTAFNDFHTLAVSVTKRLVHTTLMQTKSRLRSQRPRARHEVQPFIKRRDVLAAVDVLGMKRNGNDRWKGAARRCGLKVLTSSTTSRGKRKTVVPWDEVERIMSADLSRDSRPATDVEVSTEPEEFTKRAARSGTPLPMHNFTLPDSEDGSEPDSVIADDDEDPEDVNAEREQERLRGAPPDVEMDDPPQQLRTLEDLDREASRQEEQALWNMLGLEPRNNIEIMLPDDEAHDMDSEKIVPWDRDWQLSTQYRAYWEDNKPPSATEFLENRKSRSPMPACYGGSQSSTSPSRSMNDDSSSGARRPRRRQPAEVELRARGATAYAALQREELGGADEDDNSSSSDAADEDDDVMEQDIPTQSIEVHDESSAY